jgi:hypothetical protein
MAYVGMGGHKNQRQMCLLPEAGEFLHPRSHTQWEPCAAVCAKRPTARIVLEASTASAWVAWCVEALGHEGNANGLFAPPPPPARPAARRRATFAGAGQAPPHGVG